uniref:C2H2-type domain-containing protein n=1 Tax=Hippocampus comes TaxID=109280 RepID=A0A3Q2YXJ9_HIPCM
LVCEQRFSNSTSLKIHTKTHTSEKHFACPVCGKKFSQKGSLKIHPRMSSNTSVLAINAEIKKL